MLLLDLGKLFLACLLLLAFIRKLDVIVEEGKRTHAITTKAHFMLSKVLLSILNAVFVTKTTTYKLFG